MQFDTIIKMVWDDAKWFVICGALFTLLAYLFACNRKQPLWHKESITNILYWFAPHLFYNYAFKILLMASLAVMFMGNRDRIENFVVFRGIPAQWALWLQLACILIISDVIQYWLHRCFHRDPLWKFHAIHHSAEDIDFMVANRFHPVNFVLYATLTSVITFLLGFSMEAFALLGPFNILYSTMVHANLNWTFGPLKYVFASPVFHRWHHTYPDEGGNKNFAPTFPILDVIFGTFYMPEGRLPERYGVEEPVPADFIGQMVYPFKK